MIGRSREKREGRRDRDREHPRVRQDDCLEGCDKSKQAIGIDSYQKHAASYVKEISTNIPEHA
jgi:hypothetical protein